MRRVFANLSAKIEHAKTELTQLDRAGGQTKNAEKMKKVILCIHLQVRNVKDMERTEQLLTELTVTGDS